MSVDNFNFDGSGMRFSNSLPLHEMPRLTFLDSLNETEKYKSIRAYSAYYGYPSLPGIDQDKDKDRPIVMCSGTIVSVTPVENKGYYENAVGAKADTQRRLLNMDADGKCVLSFSVHDGSALVQNFDNTYNPVEVAGFMTVANGGQDQVVDFTDEDGVNGIIATTGGVHATASSGSDSLTIPANKPFGLVHHRVMAHLPKREMNYEVGSEGHTIIRDGVFAFPCVKVIGADPVERAKAIAKIKEAVDKRHQYVLLEGTSEENVEMEINDWFMPNNVGKFVRWESINVPATQGHATLSNIEGVVDVSTPITDGTYTLILAKDGAAPAPISTGALVGATVGDAILGIEGNLAASTIAVVGGRIVVTSNTTGAASSIVISGGTLIDELDAIVGYTMSIDAPVSGQDAVVDDKADQKFGQYIGKDNRAPFGMDAKIDGFPNGGTMSTTTAGLNRRVFHFIGSILKKVAAVGLDKKVIDFPKYSYTPVDVRADVATDVDVKFDVYIVAFGGAI